jgi:protein transport protein SEC24
MVLFRDDKKVERITMQAKHMLMSGYAKFVFARKEFGYFPFHGYIWDPRIYLGTGAFVDNGQKLVDGFIT